jgi:hypothetical protein
MRDKTMRIADLRVSSVVVAVGRRAFPFWAYYVLRERRRTERIAQESATKLGESAAQVVVEAKEGSEAMQKMTLVIVLATLVIVVATVLNTAFFIYSVIK